MSALQKAGLGARLVIDTLKTCVPAAIQTRRIKRKPFTSPSRSAIRVSLPDREIGRVDRRFLSFTVDIAQVVGGKFWGKDNRIDLVAGGSKPVAAYDFTRTRLKRLVEQLAPAYLRIGGTASDEVYYDLGEAPSSIPAGYKYALSRRQWHQVNNFTQETGLEVVFTLNAGAGPRGRGSHWNPEQARQLITYSAENSFPIAGWSLGNEPNWFPFAHNLWLTTEQVTQEYAILKSLLLEIMPKARFLGPSSAFWPVVGEMLPILPRLLEQAGTLLDVVTWHYYPQQSSRSPIAVRRARAESMLEPGFLDETWRWAEVIEKYRTRFAPQAEVWLEETGNAQCGGEPGLSDRFIGGFWWLDMLGNLARRGQKVVMRQNLSGSDYSLLDDESLQPNPDYWNSLLWKRLMGDLVLVPQLSEQRPDLRLYAHRAREGVPGKVVVLALNINRHEILTLDFDQSPLHLYLCTADELLGKHVRLNGCTLQTRMDGSIPEFEPEFVTNGLVRLPPVSYAFVVLP